MTYVIQSGDSGIGVNKMQAYLNIMHDYGFIRNKIVQDGIFGSDTKTSVQQFQNYEGISVDGIIGENTWDAVVSKLKTLNINPSIPVASSSYYLANGSIGLSVEKMQEYLNEIFKGSEIPLKEDGMYGTKTQSTVQKYQALNDLTIDGTLGWRTWDSIMDSILDM